MPGRLLRRIVLAVLAAALVLSGGVLSASSAVADEPPPPAPTELTLAGPAGDVPATDPVTLTATLTTSGQPLSGKPVRFERWTGSAWGLVATVTTNAGVAKTSLGAPYGQTRFRARYAGDDLTAPSVSDPVVVTGVRLPSVVTLSGPKSIIDEHQAALTVRLHGPENRPIDDEVVVYYRYRGGSWHYSRKVRTGADGKVTFLVKPRYDTYWYARSYRHRWWLADTSKAIFIDNRPLVAPFVYPAGAPRPDPARAQPRGYGSGVNAVTTTIPDGVWRIMVGKAWHRGCPVGRSQLRLMKLNYWGFDGYRHRGMLVINARAHRKFVGAFQDLYNARIPIHSMYLPDIFGYSSASGGANDYRAMEHDDTSAFNCRWVTGSPGVRSPHSYGYAVDINTWENPYHSAIGWLPNSWWISHSDPRVAWRSGSHQVVRIMRANGFHWTYGTGDSQHFDA